MTNTTTYGTVTGGVGHLKLHAAVPPPCPFRASTLSQFSSFASLNRAFQQATGWELDYTELTGSYRQRVRLNDPGFPALGKLSITDLSSILPPGLPAVSRIYCEKLLDEFNRVLAELAVCRQTIYRQASGSVDSMAADSLPAIESNTKQPSTKQEATKANVISMAGEPLIGLDDNPSLLAHNFAFNQLARSPDRAACDWFVDAGGVARFLVIHCGNDQSTSARELLTARATFQSECRHGVTNLAAYQAIHEAVECFFDGSQTLSILIGTLNPLTGDIAFVGDQPFRLSTTMSEGCHESAKPDQQSSIHLTQRQHLTVTYWPETFDEDQLEQATEWNLQMLRAVRDVSAADVVKQYEKCIEEAIPSLPARPHVAFAVSRH